MGMFNWVRFTAPCKKCGATLDGFQSKDSEELDLRTVEPETVEEFYDYCKCGTMNTYRTIKAHFELIDTN
jgi:hypothetical protein